jgi:hypothetical protein
MGEPDRIPSVGCLLYLAGEQVAPRKSGLGTVAIPCKRVRVDLSEVRAIVGAASYLSLRDSGHVTLRVVESSNPYRSRKGPETIRGIILKVVDSTPPDGLPGEVLKATLALTHGDSGPRILGAQSSGLHKALSGGLLGMLRYEFLELDYADLRFPSIFYWLRFDCTRIAALEETCADAVRWWQQVQVAEAALCSALLETCRIAFTPPKPDGGG